MNLDLVTYPGETDTTIEITNLAGTVVQDASQTEIQPTLYRSVVTLADGFYRYNMHDENGEVFAAGAIHVIGGVLIGQDRQVENLQRAQADREAVANVQTRLPAALVDGRIDSNVSRWNGSTPGNLDSNGFVPGNTAAINGNTEAVGTFRTWLDNNRLDVAVGTRASEANATANTNALGASIVARPTLAAIEASTVLAKEANATTNKNEVIEAIGGGALVVLPNAVDSPDRSTPAADDVLYLNESGLFVKQIKDTDKNPVDLSDFDLLFVAEVENGLDKFSSTTVSVGGASNSFFSVTLPNSMTGKDGRTLIWSLRDRTGNKRTVLGKGKIVINYAADDLRVAGT